MNPKGEEGEFYMKKSLLVLASIMILALCTFVACTAEVSDPYDGLTYVTFGGESPASRNLLASYEVASYDDLYWSYSAEKLDHYGTSGAATNAPVFENSTTKGLNNPVGPFSQGKWRFTLCAYTSGTTRNEDTKVYEGSVEVSIKGQKVTVPVSVTPYGETGALKFSGAYFAWKDNGKDAPDIKIVAKGTKTGQIYTLGNKIADDNTNPEDAKIKLDINSVGDNKTYKITDCEYSTVKADYYNCTIIAYINIDGSQTPVFSQTFGFRVYGSTTTTISGDITEGEFTGVDFSVENMAVIEMSKSSKASLSVTPSGVEGKTTDVDFSNAGLSGKHVLVVDVDSAVEASNFTIEGVDSASQSIVAGIGLELSSVGETTQTPVTSFGDGKVVVVTTYIAKGLNNVTVKYNGTTNGGDPTNVQYNKSTGELTFTTTHFSEFYVVADKIEAIDITHNEAVTSLVSIYPSDYNNSTIVLVDDVENFDAIYDGVSNLTIDLNSHKIIGNGIAHFVFDLYRESILQESSVSFVGKGSIVCNTPNDEVSSSVFVVRNRGVLTIGPDIVLEGPNGILIDKDSSNFHNNLGAIVNFKGTINVSEDKGFGITVNGSNSYTGDDAPAFNLDGAKINVPNGVGIYAAGYANWNISGNTEITGYNTAIEIRAGNMTIDSGTFKSTATAYSCSKNDGGATTTGAAIAVAQHNTNLPIDVVITGTPKLSGVYALSVTNPQGNTKDAISNVKVTINENVEKIYVSTDFIREGNVIRAKTTEEDSKYVACLSDGRNFTTLQAAVDAVKNTGYITLLEGASVVKKDEHRIEGDGILIDDNKGLNLTIDFGGLTYFVNGYRVGSNFAEAFHLGKGNTIVLKNGAIKSTTGSTAQKKSTEVLIKNYSNLMLEDIALSCDKKTQSVLSCVYGTTHITGNTSIVGSSFNKAQNNALEVYLCLSDYKEGVEVVFDDAFKGMVSGYVLFTTEENVCFDGTNYKHSLIIKNSDSKCFESAKFGFIRVCQNSCFKMKTLPTIKASNTYTYPLSATESADGYYYFADPVVVNKTTDQRYTDAYIAIQNSPSSFESKLVLQNNCEYKTSMNFSLAKRLSIDLNGKELKIADASQVIKFANNGVLTIENGCDDGSIVFPSGMTFESFFSGASKGQLVINGGTFNSDPTLYVNTETHKISEDKDTGTWTVTAKN